ncbi:hypothetical protein TNCV_2259521 [Trichonephila clavipes]|nr:hypothetical protein TNCV_2259521 [Trichonephila clavipes]
MQAHCFPCWTPWWVEASQNEVSLALMDQSPLCPGKGLNLPTLTIDDIATYSLHRIYCALRKQKFSKDFLIRVSPSSEESL